jgi:beta-1,4-mannosyl-glycoprotein beta-1,4-N-acetylglucosaminyltransferase
MINDELDLLELRLNTLFPFVERFVIVESEKTHSGKPKELNFLKNKDRFEKFSSKIIYLQYHGNAADAWGRENCQRNFILNALDIEKPEDGLLFVSDIDEIPKPEKLFEAKEIACNTDMPVALHMFDCMYYMNFSSNLPYKGPYLYNPNLAKEVHAKFGCGVYSPCDFRWHTCSVEFGGDFKSIKEAGWHFSTLGGVGAIRKKLESYAHAEFNREDIKSDEHLIKCMSEGIPFFEKVFSFHGSPVRYSKKEIDFLPDYVKFNLDKYNKYLV